MVASPKSLFSSVCLKSTSPEIAQSGCSINIFLQESLTTTQLTPLWQSPSYLCRPYKSKLCCKNILHILERCGIKIGLLLFWEFSSLVLVAILCIQQNRPSTRPAPTHDLQVIIKTIVRARANPGLEELSSILLTSSLALSPTITNSEGSIPQCCAMCRRAAGSGCQGKKVRTRKR